MAVILIMCGDIESNPGPMRGGRSGQRQPEGVGTRSRQRTLSQYSLSQPEGTRRNSFGYNLSGPTASSGPTGPEVESQESMFNFLRQMKDDLAKQNNSVSKDISEVNRKIDSISDSVNCLRTENDKLRAENKTLRDEMASMKSQLDKLEGHSRRNNVRIHGIEGTINENWTECESKVRNFIKNDLGLPDMESVEIERAHRVKSKAPNACTIIVKFSKFKDRECILNKAKSVLSRDTGMMVQPDYTERVKKHRRVLGERLVQERQKNKYASIRFDKLIVDNEIFKYDEREDKIVCIGKRLLSRAHDRARGNNVNNDGAGSGLAINADDTRSAGAWGITSDDWNLDEPINERGREREIENEGSGRDSVTSDIDD